jgi:hypothetical protein
MIRRKERNLGFYVDNPCLWNTLNEVIFYLEPKFLSIDTIISMI